MDSIENIIPSLFISCSFIKNDEDDFALLCDFKENGNAGASPWNPR